MNHVEVISLCIGIVVGGVYAWQEMAPQSRANGLNSGDEGEADKTPSSIPKVRKRYVKGYMRTA